MAGGEDYIPIRTALVDDPDVLRIARRLNKDQDLVAGKLLRFWSWASRITADGRLGPYTTSYIDTKVVGCRGFCDALQSFRSGIGWLVQDGDELVIPKWDEWMSSSAKARAGEAVRKKLQRVSLDHRPDKCPDKCLDQSSREQKKEEEEKRQKQQSATGDSARGDEDPGPAARNMRESEGCSLLLLGIPALSAREAAQISREPQATRMQVAWVAERYREEVEAKTVFAKGVGAWVHSMIRDKVPPRGWREQYGRRQIALLGAKVALSRSGETSA